MFAESFSENRKTWLYISSGLIIVLALILRLWNLGSESAWIDEAYSIALSNHSILDILKGTAADQHPPLYYLLLKFWLLFGSGVTYARLLSVIIGVINVGQILHFGYRSAGILISLMAGLLVAVSPMHVWYSQEIRMYILLVSLTTASTAALWWASRGKKRRGWIFYCIFSILSIYTHYFAVFVFIAQGVWMLAWAWKREKLWQFWYWLGSMAVTGLLFLPWLPIAINQTRFHTMTWVTSPTLFIIRDTLLRLIFGIAVISLPDLVRWLVFFVVFVVFIWSLIKYLRHPRTKKDSYFLIFSWGVLPFTLISIIALIYPVYQFKQYLIVLLPILFLAAWITYGFPKKLAIPSFIILVLAATVSLAYQQALLTKDDWRGTAKFIARNALPEDVFFGNPAATSLAISLYTEVPINYTGIPENYNIITGGWEGEALTTTSANQILGELAQSFERLWLVEFFPEFWDQGQHIETWLKQNAIIQSDQNFGRIRVRIYLLTE
jgi:uncharacterized membrane protein